MRITEESDYDIRYSTKEDLSFLHAWLGECPQWYPVASAKDIEAMAKNWILGQVASQIRTIASSKN